MMKKSDRTILLLIYLIMWMGNIEGAFAQAPIQKDRSL